MKKETVILVTKYLLDVMYFLGIVVTISLPWSVGFLIELFQLQEYESNKTEIIIIYFVLGVLAIMILGELRKIFRTVMREDCFVKDNVVSLDRMGTYSFFIALVCLVQFILYLALPVLVLVLVFLIAGLFSKVLSFVFDKAVEYKLENDLTI
jgi:hypothetical protein